MKEYTSVEQFLQDLPELAKPVRDALKGHDNLFRVEFEDSSVYFISIDSGAVSVTNECSRVPSCILRVKKSTVLDLVAGKISPVKALLFGGIHVQGDAKPLIRLCSLVGGK